MLNHRIQNIVAEFLDSTYWMAGLAHDAAHFFKFLFILVLYSLAMTLFVRPAPLPPSRNAKPGLVEFPSCDRVPQRGDRHPVFGAHRALPDDVRGILRALERHPSGHPMAAVALPVEIHARGALCQRSRLWPHDPGHTARCARQCVCRADHANGEPSFVAASPLFERKTDLCGAVVRIWAEQLLQGRACALCVHRGLRDLRDICRVAEGARAAVIRVLMMYRIPTAGG